MIRRLTVNTLKSLALAIGATALLVAGVQLCGPPAEASPTAQASQTRNVDWYYWLDTNRRVIERGRLDGSGVVETIVTSAEMSSPTDFEVDGGYVYWTDDGHNEIRRKSADGTGSVETLASASISAPNRIAVGSGYVYWSDTSLRTINRVSAGGGTPATIADSNDGVSNPAAIARDGSYLYWADDGNDSIRRVATFGSNAATALVSADISTPTDIAVDGSYAYWSDGGNQTIKRAQTFGSHTVTELVSNGADTPLNHPSAIALDGGHLYWVDQNTNSAGRVADDGRAGSYETISDAGVNTPLDLVISPGGKAAYWTDDNYAAVQRRNVDGSAGVISLGASNLNLASVLRVSRGTELIDGACITDVGALTADFGSHEWDGDIDAACERAFYTFFLNGDADLRIAASSGSIDPVPVLREGGLGGEMVALTTASGGNATPMVYAARAGQHTVEVNRRTTSSQTSGSFAATIQTQPMLEGCDVNLGTLSTEPVSVFGGYDVNCGDHRDYFFYLEYQASVSISASASGFTPRIEVRPGSASDSSTPAAEQTGNPADIYQALASGSFRVHVENIAQNGTYNLTFQAFGLPPPTRTPIPTPTPRFQPNQDVRLEPDPRGIRYEAGEVYRFRVEGGAGSFPAIVRSSNGDAFRITTEPDSSLDCNAGSELDNVRALQVVYVHACATAAGSTIEVLRRSDYALLAQYGIQSRGEDLPAPDAVAAPGDYVAPPEDRIGLSILINTLCDGANVECQVDLIRNGIGAAGSVALFVVPTRVARGRVGAFAYGIGVAAFIIGMLLANRLIGMPMWWSGVALICVGALFFAGLILKFRRVAS